MNRLALLVIFILTVRQSELLQVLYNAANHPHHLVTFQKLPDSEGSSTTYKQIDRQKADIIRPSNQIYKYDPYRNIGPILGKLRNPPNSHYPDIANILTPRTELRERERPNQVPPIRNRDERHVSILELFIKRFHNIAGRIPVLERSDNLGSNVREMMGNIRKSDWMTLAVVASSIIAIIFSVILYDWSEKSH